MISASKFDLCVSAGTYSVRICFIDKGKISLLFTVSHYPSLAQRQSETTKEGNVITFPSQILLRGDEIFSYANDPDLEDRLKLLFDAKGS